MVRFEAAVGGFFEGSIDFVAKEEIADPVSWSDTSYTDAPTGRIIDSINGIGNVGIDDEDLTSGGGSYNTIVQGISLNITKNNARLQFGIGSSSAAGMAPGTLEVSGTLSVYFRNLAMYNLYQAESAHTIAFQALDDQGQGYVIVIPAATLVNPNIVAGGPDTDLVAEFDLEGNPGLLTGMSAGDEFTVQIVRFN